MGKSGSQAQLVTLPMNSMFSKLYLPGRALYGSSITKGEQVWQLASYWRSADSYGAALLAVGLVEGSRGRAKTLPREPKNLLVPQSSPGRFKEPLISSINFQKTNVAKGLID